jgi:NAD(P)H-dependent FMN reductase
MRTRSFNQRLLALAERVAEGRGADVDHAGMADFECPFYDADVESASGLPAAARAFADRLGTADGLLLASPEYNASMPGTIKNLIDWVSRLRPQPFNGKQAFLLSASPSMAGGNRGLWALRIPLEHLGMRVYPDMFSLAQAHQAFDSRDELANAVLHQRLETALGCFLDLVEAAKHYPTVRKRWIEFLGEQPNVATEREETAPVEVD